GLRSSAPVLPRMLAEKRAGKVRDSPRWRGTQKGVGMIVKVRDLLAAEERLERAEKALRELDDPDNWDAYETLQGRADGSVARVLNITERDEQRREHLQAEVVRATEDLLALQRAWGGGAR